MGPPGRVAAALLFLTVAWAYFPSLGHPPRADQWAFLVDTYDEERFVPMVLGTYSYNRTREVYPGDYQLFRPGLFALLCAEKALFGHRYAFWQAFGIGFAAKPRQAVLRRASSREAARRPPGDGFRWPARRDPHRPPRRHGPNRGPRE